jgi:hypothetical protein
MTEVYIIRNQHQLYLDKQGAWVDGSDSHQLFRTRFKDEAINTKVELSVRQPELRLTLVAGVMDERSQISLAPAAQSAIDPTAQALFSPSDNPVPDRETSSEHESASEEPARAEKHC